jgi:diguanylate cyclase (GGDEF)-like protein
MTHLLDADGGPVGVEAPAGISVLLIEDNLLDVMATQRTVAAEGLPYRMQVARSVARARELLNAQSFDVILADYALADGTSFDLMDVFADQLVIFITGAWDEADAALALRHGVHDYLIKDIEGKYLKLLHYRVETALRQRRTARALRNSEARLRAILNNAPASISARDAAGGLILSNRHHDALATGGPPTSPQPFEGEETLTHVDGTEHTYHTVRFPMPDAEGSISAFGEISVDITARKRAEQQIRQLAYFDPLTALPNRRMLLDRMQQAFATSARHGGCGALFFIDLDHFKALNDSLGHDHGDLLLIEVAHRLLACVRGEDTVARIGGDEFLVMIISLDSNRPLAAAQAARVGEKIMQAVGQPCQLREHRYTVTPSVGVSVFHGRDVDADDLIKRADVAMYQAKAAGRGTLRFFDPAMQAARDLRESLEVDLRRAVAQGQLRLHYQAQVDANRRIVGVEALLRWHHPRQGILLPDMFLPLAEQTGLILGIGDWVVEQACAQLAAWARRPASRGLRLSVNVSARQFRHEEFTAHLDTALRRHGAVPQRLRLEVRETVLQADPVVALARMNAARQLGVGFAIDGFGISLSSISHLRRLPIEQIKISPALISTLPDDAHDEAVVRTIVCIARELRLATLACGVETEDQRGCLEAMGCLNWQGHLFGHPVPLAEFEARLQALHVITGSAASSAIAAQP